MYQLPRKVPISASSSNPDYNRVAANEINEEPTISPFDGDNVKNVYSASPIALDEVDNRIRGEFERRRRRKGAQNAALTLGGAAAGGVPAAIFLGPILSGVLFPVLGPLAPFAGYALATVIGVLGGSLFGFIKSAIDDSRNRKEASKEVYKQVAKELERGRPIDPKTKDRILDRMEQMELLRKSKPFSNRIKYIPKTNTINLALDKDGAIASLLKENETLKAKIVKSSVKSATSNQQPASRPLSDSQVEALKEQRENNDVRQPDQRL